MEQTQEAALEIERAAKILEEAAIFGANAYANGGPGGTPIVARHFTKGNEGRYGWAPLTPAYAAWKAKHRPGKPMLVARGELKAAVVDIPHKIVAGGDQAIIVFEVPEYGLYHHEGAGYLPKRSPVEPNAEDVAEVANAMKRYLDAQLGTGGAVPINHTSVPGMARTENPA
jgi:hypothetical protein